MLVLCTIFLFDDCSENIKYSCFRFAEKQGNVENGVPSKQDSKLPENEVLVVDPASKIQLLPILCILDSFQYS